MADTPSKSASPTHPASGDDRSRMRQWFAEAREASAKDDAEVKSWRMEMRDFGYCLSDSLWERITWSIDQPFHWRDKLRRRQGKPARRFWES